uniref:CSON004535 protein n=1 Tax=Culicoides sonorensis TaxID=179676 RepID=A0A336MP77_CULSO
MTPKYFFAIAVLLVFTFAFEADALKCYLCGTSPGLQNCTENSFGSEMSCDFAPQNASCIKQWTGAQVIHRGCYVSGYCQSNSNCDECKSDLCNASNSLILPLVLINSLIFLLFRLF